VRLQAHASGPAQLAWTLHLNRRLRASWAIVLLFTAAFLLGVGAVTLVFALASFFALREFVSLTPIKPSDHWALVVAFYVVIPLQYLLVWADWYGLYAVFIPVYVFLILPVIMAWRQNTEHFLERIAKVQWGLMICVYCVSHAPAIASLEIGGNSAAAGAQREGRGALLLLYFLLVLQLSAILAIVASASFGRTPLASDPRRSREGVVIGGAAAAVVGTLLWWMTPFAWWQAGLMSVGIVVSGVLGERVLALVKQSLGNVGASRWGDGRELSRGALDRMSALSFAAPVFFHLTLVFFSP
jgi:phosphatidate cytidylyltransferase